jgi:putative Mg2+ transporter-C (MgtC) family protein
MIPSEIAYEIVTSNATLALRLLVAAIAGALIGYEREYMGKAAGLRTYALVSLGSCLFTLVSIFGVQQLPPAISPSEDFNYNYDGSRIASTIVTGIGFLGAGSIILRGSRVEGLTTAAGLWVAAALGMAIGYGYYALTGVAVITTLAVLLFLKRIEPKDHGHEYPHDSQGTAPPGPSGPAQ